MLKLLIQKVWFTFLILIPTLVSSADYYWRVVAVNNNFNNPNNWTGTPNGIGGNSPGTAPTINDDLYFVATSNYMHITSSIECNMHSLTCTAPAMVTLNANKNWLIVGNIFLNGSLTIPMENVYLTQGSTPENVTIDMSKSDPHSLINTLIISKPNYRVDIINNDLNLTGGIGTNSGEVYSSTSGIDSIFYSNGNNIIVSFLNTAKPGFTPRTIDFGGSETEFDVIYIDCYQELLTEPEISPNPCNNFIKINIPELNANEEFNIKIFNDMEDCVITAKTKGELDISHLVEGVYYVRIYLADNLYYKKIIKTQ